METVSARIVRKFCYSTKQINSFLTGLTDSAAILNGCHITTESLAEINAEREEMHLPIIVPINPQSMLPFRKGIA